MLTRSISISISIARSPLDSAATVTQRTRTQTATNRIGPDRKPIHHWRRCLHLPHYIIGVVFVLVSAADWRAQCDRLDRKQTAGATNPTGNKPQQNGRDATQRVGSERNGPLSLPHHTTPHLYLAALHTWTTTMTRSPQTLRANDDVNTAVKNELSPPIVGANVVRLLPFSAHLRTVCMRLELHGCQYDGKCSHSAAGAL